MKRASTLVVAVILFLPALAVMLCLLVWRSVRLFNRHHAQVSESARDVAKASKVIAALAGLWAWLVAPTGLAAIGASLGIVSTPLVVVLAPALLALAGAAMTVSAALDLYSKWRSRRSI